MPEIGCCYDPGGIEASFSLLIFRYKGELILLLDANGFIWLVKV